MVLYRYGPAEVVLGWLGGTVASVPGQQFLQRPVNGAVVIVSASNSRAFPFVLSNV